MYSSFTHNIAEKLSVAHLHNAAGEASIWFLSNRIDVTLLHLIISERRGVRQLAGFLLWYLIFITNFAGYRTALNAT